ncbi:penicillin-binding protein 1C [Draconibacterium halophilum]|uniref:peptidoglycan glycosyltransferase n=1 Tax=Draconibacterium halophilum TaxID=2706887 RepID=A0A6C0RBS1_9BACT|nr:penicillin-binding protein 1C [Draconibacterium halophilum]QIA07770.1 penicillin-binding protein 1C [Draconibacterium halophilum]
MAKLLKNRRWWKWWSIGLLSLLVLFLFSGIFVPRPLFTTSYSTVVESSNGDLLGARISDDEQWRFPAGDRIPHKYELCVLQFEDKHFYHHPGVNLASIARAIFQNIKARKVVSGGSTITMQVSRLARGNRTRNLKNKLIEVFWALHIELRYSKAEILKLYASHAPFGGNVVGIEAASWRYFARESEQLSWAESATLAVLPNAPSLIYPGRSDDKLKQKRDRLLQKLLANGTLDSMTCELAVAEPLPEKVNALPNAAYHFTELVNKEKRGQRIHSTIDYAIQNRVNIVVRKHQHRLKSNYINNMAVVVAEIPSKKVRAYVGNTFSSDGLNHGNFVDVVQSPRSTGSILKPFLYCKMMDNGLLLPGMLVPDIPIRFGGFTPMNFDRQYIGAVSAEEALARSLNIPAVHLLREFGVAPFYSFLKQAGMSTLYQSPDYYGLSLILGGAEVKLWDLAGMYASLATILDTYNKEDGLYFSKPFSPLLTNEDKSIDQPAELEQSVIRAASIYSTFKALLEVTRPESEKGWERFARSKKIAWKTGTSFGFRDAWAVGITPKYVVAVWVGNADGEGRAGLTGVSAAAPVMFDVFSTLPGVQWFNTPIDEMDSMEVCNESGFLPGENCDNRKVILVPKGNKIGVCQWHQRIHLNAAQTHRVNANCHPVSKMVHKNWFVLPPAMEYYYKQENVLYATLPPLMPGCTESQQQLDFIYPREWNRVFIPVELDGTKGKFIVELAHRLSNVDVYWYLDNNFLGITQNIHQFELRPEPGWHTITVSDNLGNILTKKFFVVNR